jgi:excinuclease ABC subunit B
MMLPLERGQRIDREQILRKLVEIQYERNDHDFGRGVFRVRGDIVEVYLSYEESALRIELFGDEVDELSTIDPLTGKTLRKHDKVTSIRRPTSAPREKTKLASTPSRRSSSGTARSSSRKARSAPPAPADDVRPGDDQGDQYCHGIENYAAPTGRPPARRRRRCSTTCRPTRSRSWTSPDRPAGPRHVSRRSLAQGVLVAYGFRLPSALDNRPLNFEEWRVASGR